MPNWRSEIEALIFEGVFAEASEDGEVICDVLLCGLESLNGYTIPTEAFGGEERVKALYANQHVYLDHNQEKGISRSSTDLAGIVINPRVKNGRPYGDILTADTENGQELRRLYKFTKKAESVGGKVNNLSMSHVASYEFEQGRKSVKAVSQVFSCDVVIRGATTRTFHEQATNDLADLKTQVEGLKAELDSVKLELSGLKARQPGPTSSERKEEGNKPFDPAKALENISFS